MGELLRRYWQLICTSDELQDLPKKVKLLSNSLFRVGLLRGVDIGKWATPLIATMCLFLRRWYGAPNQWSGH
jgi:hypothetical protein